MPSSQLPCTSAPDLQDDGWPGDIVLHPAFLGGLVVLIVNDHVLKERAPGLVTGKLSDLAGLAMFPMLLVALVEAVRWVGDRHAWRATPATFATASAATVAGFVAIKTIGPAGDVYRTTLGWSQWVVSAAPEFFAGEDVGTRHRAELIMDRSDIVAAPMALISLWIGASLRRGRPDPIQPDKGA